MLILCDFFIDLLLFSLSLLCGYLIRFEFVMSPGMLDQFFHLLPLVLAVKSLSFFFMHMYKGMFRYAGLADLWRLVKAVALSTLILLVSVLMLHRFQGISRAVFPIDAVLTLFFTGGLRLFIRYIFKEYMVHKGDGNVLPLFHTDKDKTPVLIYGGWQCRGKALPRDFRKSPAQVPSCGVWR